MIKNTDVGQTGTDIQQANEHYRKLDMTTTTSNSWNKPYLPYLIKDLTIEENY